MFKDMGGCSRSPAARPDSGPATSKRRTMQVVRTQPDRPYRGGIGSAEFARHFTIIVRP